MWTAHDHQHGSRVAACRLTPSGFLRAFATFCRARPRAGVRSPSASRTCSARGAPARDRAVLRGLRRARARARGAAARAAASGSSSPAPGRSSRSGPTSAADRAPRRDADGRCAGPAAALLRGCGHAARGEAASEILQAGIELSVRRSRRRCRGARGRVGGAVRARAARRAARSRPCRVRAVRARGGVAESRRSRARSRRKDRAGVRAAIGDDVPSSGPFAEALVDAVGTAEATLARAGSLPGRSG